MNNIISVRELNWFLFPLTENMKLGQAGDKRVTPRIQILPNNSRCKKDNTFLGEAGDISLEEITHLFFPLPIKIKIQMYLKQKENRDKGGIKWFGE